MTLSYLLSGISLFAWIGFNFYGAFEIFALPLTEEEKLLLNLGLSVA